MMPVSKTGREIYEIRKLKKDGSISCNHVDNVVHALRCGELFVMPVDSIYGIVGINRNDVVNSILELSGDLHNNLEIIISNFKMLEEIAQIDKFSYDFLKRVWPGEVTVQLKSRQFRSDNCILMRMPKHKYLLDIVSGVGKPLVYMPAKSSVRKMIFNDKEIIRRFKNFCSLLLINEFNKIHTLPTLIDISCDKLTILNEGRVSSDEIKSLYFLGDM
ncbi:MAG TPA: Sua5/YciO/YrdC/YwlC family protein [Spirochaetota bacterium]|nr:Sua5/YciO/YrdC/YwlC family protein [Spirochaetota bacterium]